MVEEKNYFPGLEGVIAAETFLSQVDGERGTLVIAGYPLEEIALQASFEETVYLLWYDRRASSEELVQFKQQLNKKRILHPLTLEVLEQAAKEKTSVMDALRMSVATLDLGETSKSMQENQVDREKAIAILAKIPTIIASYWRLLKGESPLEPDSELSQAANYLYLLTGKKPTAAFTRGLETYLNTVIDHGFNASTFTARIITSTQSDLVSAVVGALGALKGPRHGGAPGPALDMVFEIGTPEKAEAYLRRELEKGNRLMGFGHRVYKVYDPRAVVLAKAAEKMYQAEGDLTLYHLAREVENTALKLLEEYKPGRNLKTNVEFYTALLLHGLGLSKELFTPTFAFSRTAGWIAHCFEQQRSGRLIRPKAVYRGELNKKWTA